MKKALIFGPIYTVLEKEVDDFLKVNIEMSFKAQSQTVGGGGYSSTVIYTLFNFPYLLAVQCGKGIYGDAAYEIAKAKGVKVEQGTRIAGCAYRFYDASGFSNAMYMPAGEYSLNRKVLKKLDPDDIGCVIVYSEMLCREEAHEIIAILHYLNKPIYFAINARMMEMDPDILEDLYELQPIVVFEEKDIEVLYADEDMHLDRILDDIYSDALNDVYILNHEEGNFLYDGQERVVFPSQSKTNLEIFVSILSMAKSSFMNNKKALSLASRLAINTLEEFEENVESLKDTFIKTIV